jgi:hypothetical protein
MTSEQQHVSVESDHRIVAEADVRTDSHSRIVQADLHVEAGHQPPGVRAELVDLVVEQVNAHPGARLRATVPAGDAEMLSRMRERCDDLTTRPAGSTVLVDGAPSHQ